jgi:hypothetical protein
MRELDPYLKHVLQTLATGLKMQRRSCDASGISNFASIRNGRPSS